jgi:hypothetical protein
MKKTLWQALLQFSVVYSFATLVSSSLQLIQGQVYDTNTHILDRAIVVLIGIITLQLILKLSLRPKFLNIVIPYCISMGLVFLYVFFTGLFTELHPNAYRDIFLNYTIAFIVVVATVQIFLFIKKRQRGK